MKEGQRPPPERLKGHDLIVARSLALHRALAEKIRARPDLIQVVRGNLKRWIVIIGSSALSRPSPTPLRN